MMGKVIMSGIVPQLVAPITGILASDLAVGSSVYLMENGVATEYLVVNQGIPSGSSLYDASCDGTWLLRKDVYVNRAWHSSRSNSYKASTIHTYLNDTFFNLLGTIEQGTIKQVKIPYVNGTGSGGSVASGSSGLTAKVFFLSGRELGFPDSGRGLLPDDGAKLDYFTSVSSDEKRIAYLDGTATTWWTRSPEITSTGSVCTVYNGAGYDTYGFANSSRGVRPALVLPSNALFDKNTMLLMGVK